jgi:alanine racemase
MTRHARTDAPSAGPTDAARPARDRTSPVAPAAHIDDRDRSRAWVEIDLGALARNAAAMARAAGVPLLPMVKADAYGLGALAVVDALLPLSPWGFGVATVREGEELRSAGVTQPIVHFTPVLPTQYASLRALRVTPVLGSAEAIATWIESGGGTWHLGVDTGMSRAGVPWREVASVAPLCERHPPEGAATHFHSAELGDGTRDEQERRFAAAVATLPARPRLLHAENSPAIAHRHPSRWDLARPGVFLYGVGTGGLEPDPVVTLRARIVEVRRLEPGDTVSYDATWRAGAEARIATASLGYADGYRRAFSNTGAALIDGRAVPVVGNVTMDMTMLDVSGVPCAPGDVATFIGRDGDALFTVADVAARGALSPYELLTGLRARMPRMYEGAP